MDAGLIQRKKELWMPEGWRELVKGAQPLEVGQLNSDYLEEIRLFDDFENEYRQNKEWMH